METQAFRPSANFSSGSQIPHDTQHAFAPFRPTTLGSVAIQNSPWCPQTSPQIFDQGLNRALISEPKYKSPAESLFSDLNSAQMSAGSTDVSTSSEQGSLSEKDSSPTTSYPSASEARMTPTVNPFRPSSSDFVPTFTPTASTFTTQSRSFQPQMLPKYAAPGLGGTFYPAPNHVDNLQAQHFVPMNIYGPEAYHNGATMMMHEQQQLMMTQVADPDGKYKTELCKNWIETAKCRYEHRCRFAHGQDELTQAAVIGYNEKFKTNNCRTFYHTKACMYGSRCMFRHEHRYFKQLHRHYYTPQMFVFESLFCSSVNQRKFIDSYKPTTQRLPVFAEVHAAYDAQQAQEQAEVEEQELSEAEMSEIEMSLELINSASSFNAALDKSPYSESKQSSFLNTTQDSSNNEECPQKFALNLTLSPAFAAETSGSEEEDSQNEELEVSADALGLHDFL